MADARTPATAATAETAATAARRVGPFASARHRSRFRWVLAGLIAAAVVLTVLTVTWGNAQAPGSDPWWRIVDMRLTSIIVIAVVTFSQAFATVSFQTVTGNRIITPSIMGFEAMYVLIQTLVVYVFGISGLANFNDFGRFLLQVGVMVTFAVLLYSWLLSGKYGNVHVMLLVGIVIGTGVGAMSAFMQRMLDPNEFDVLTARLFGNVGNANAEYLAFVVPVCALTGLAIWLLAPRLNVLALGGDISATLGLRHRRQSMLILTLVAILMAMSTALVGPMTFLGFLIATLAYSVTDTYDHRRILPVAWLMGYVILGGAYFLLRHVLTMVDAVTIIVELVGGLLFLFVILRKGRL